MKHLTNISPLDGRYHTQTEPLAEICSEFGLMKYRVQVEIAWLKSLAAEKDIKEISCNAQQLAKLDSISSNFSLADAAAIKEIEKTTNHDVKAIEYFVRDALKEYPTLLPFVHFACTSEDINNLSYALMVKDAREIVVDYLQQIIISLKQLTTKYTNTAMLSRTHGQPASPTTMGKELANVSYRLERKITRIKNQELLGKINGAVGNYNAHKVAYTNINWQALSKRMIEDFGLTFNPYTTQIEPHDYLAELFTTIAQVNHILIDCNRDIWSYISLGYFKQKAVATETGSSTMPHKVNPIDFENSEGNCGLANAILNHLANTLPISRWQRDLTDSTVLRNIGVGLGHSIIAYQSHLKGLTKLEVDTQRMLQDLTDNPEVLTEAIQTMMRKYGYTDAYEQLKQHSRGQKMSMKQIQMFIQQLDLPQAEKDILLHLTPESYIGIAKELAN